MVERFIGLVVTVIDTHTDQGIQDIEEVAGSSPAAATSLIKYDKNMKLTDKIRNKIAKRRERKAKLQKFADVIEFAEHKGHKYISLSEGIVSGKFITSNGIGEASPAYIWKDNAGNVHIEGNLIIEGNITGRIPPRDELSAHQ